MIFPSRILEGKFVGFMAGKGLRKPFDKIKARYGRLCKTSKLKFCKLDFGKKTCEKIGNGVQVEFLNLTREAED